MFYPVKCQVRTFADLKTLFIIKRLIITLAHYQSISANLRSLRSATWIWFPVVFFLKICFSKVNCADDILFTDFSHRSSDRSYGFIV